MPVEAEAVAAGFSEYARKAVHIAMGGFALLLAYLPWPVSFLLAVGALLHNVFLLPRYAAEKLFRTGSARASRPDAGIVLYPSVIALLILLLRNHLEIVAAAWGALAFGDGMATVAGKALGGPRLPWNREKTWSGLLAFLLAGGYAGFSLFWWTFTRLYAHDPAFPGYRILVTLSHASHHSRMIYLAPPLLAVLCAAIVESLPLGIDDNISVPLVTAGILTVLYFIDPYAWEISRPHVLRTFPWAVGVNAALGLAAYAARSVSISGLAGGAFLGTVVFCLGGGRSFAVMLAFFLLGTAATKVGYVKKEAAGIAQEKGGRRGAKNAFANCGMGAILALLAAVSPLGPLALFGLVAAFATACADTVSSELGQAYGRTTYLITSFRRVPHGTEGAVSLEGTLAGIAASIVLAALGWALGLVGGAGAAVIVVAAFVGTTVESYLGATLEQRNLIGNEAINFANTLVGALTAMGLAQLLGLAG